MGCGEMVSFRVLFHENSLLPGSVSGSVPRERPGVIINIKKQTRPLVAGIERVDLVRQPGERLANCWTVKDFADLFEYVGAHKQLDMLFINKDKATADGPFATRHRLQEGRAIEDGRDHGVA